MSLKNQQFEVTVIKCNSVHFDCPACGDHQDGFMGNPAGGTFTCDGCGVEYRVHPEADIEFW